MLIDGREYKINILILLMEGEIGVTVQTVETLLEGMEEGVTISVLLNGGRSGYLRKLFSGFAAIRYYESKENLGVAGGRNYLLKTDECRGSDIVMILDNDVVPPLDYVRGLATFLIRHGESGVVGSVVADIKRFRDDGRIMGHYGEPGAFGNPVFRITSSRMKELIAPGLSPDDLFSIGVHPDFMYAYMSLRKVFYIIGQLLFDRFGLKLKKNYHPSLKSNSRYIELIRNGKDEYCVSTVGGGSQAFRRGLLDEIGHLDDRFNPYSHEDVEFCIRSIKSGKKNYIDTNTWLFHGTDDRHNARDPVNTARNFYRANTILASCIEPGHFRFRLTILKLIYATFLAELILSPMHPGWAIRRLRARLDGYRKGLEQISKTTEGTRGFKNVN